MKRSHFLGHMVFPAVFALGGLLFGLLREPVSVELLLAHLVGGGLFYAAPHMLWAAVAAAVKPANLVSHAGFVASSFALALVGAMSLLGPRDPSGLPYQWLVYWPLAGTLLLLVVVGWFLAGRPHGGV